MKQISGILFCLLTVIVLGSCQKELSIQVNNPFTPALGNKVLTYSETDTVTGPGGPVIYSDSFRLTYDGNDRLLSLTNVLSPGDNFIFAYGTGSYTMLLNVNNAPDVHEVFYLNSHPFVDSTFQYNSTNDSSTEKYTYDASWRLSSLKEYDYSAATGSVLSNQTNYTYDANGNMLTETDITTGEIYNYEYYSDLNTVFMGQVYAPGNKNLVKKTIYTDGVDTVISSYTYTFDSLNRVTSERAVSDNGLISVKRYTY